MQWENSLHAFAVGDAAHGKCFIQAAAFTADHYSRKYLDSFFVAFYHAGMNAHAVAHRKRVRVAFCCSFSMASMIWFMTISPRAGTESFQHAEENCNCEESSDLRI